MLKTIRKQWIFEATIILVLSLLSLFTLFLGFALATQVEIQGTVDGNMTFDTTFQNDEITSREYININGIGYYKITFTDGSEELVELKDYISSQESEWSIDKSGINVDELVRFIEMAVEAILGNRQPDRWEGRIAYALLKAFVTRQEYYDTIEMMTYRIESLENAMEESNKESFCLGKIEVMLDHDLISTTCNGDTYINSNGKAILVQKVTTTTISYSMGGGGYCENCI